MTLKQYRFEIGFASLAAALAAGLGWLIDVRVDALAVSRDCLDQVNGSPDGAGISEACTSMARAGSEILGSTFLNSGGSPQLSIMGMLPFLVGLLGGLPVVSRELEDRTAQTAWWLNGSRRRWLAGQVAPIVIVLGAVTVIAALAASAVADDWVRWYSGERARLIGTYGALTVVRAFGAFGIGIVTGAVLGRSLSAFVSSVALLLILLVVAGQAQEVWYTRLPIEPLWVQSSTTRHWEPIGGVPRAVGWGAADGVALTQEQARERAIDAGVQPAQPTDSEDPAYAWLVENGYTEITFGLTDEAAAGWAPLDGAIFAVVGTIGLAAAFVVVSRRRPT